MATAKNVARESYELMDHFRSQRRSWANEVAKDIAYYLGKQWSDQDRLDLLARGKAPLVFNIIRPHVDGKKGIIAANSPQFVCSPRGDDDAGTAKVFDAVMDYIWYISEGRMQFLQTADEYCKVGLGWMQVDIDPFMDDNRGEVIVRYVPWNYVYVDPATRRKDFADARRIIISMRVPRESAMLMYPDQRNRIKRAEPDGDNDWESTEMHTETGIIMPDDYDYTDTHTQDYVRIIERYELGYHKFFAVYHKDALHPEYIPAEEFNRQNWPANTDADELLLKRCRRIVTVGQSVLISDELLPCDDYPIVPFVNVHTHTPFPHGDVRDLRDPQDEKNKRRMVIIHHAMAAGTNRVITPEGLVDVALWERKLAIPGAVLEYSPIPGMAAPQPFPTEQIPNAFFAMEEKSERDVENISGVFPGMLGDAANAPDTYRASRMFEEAGTRRIRGNDLTTIDHGLGRLGRVAVQFAQYHYRYEKVLRIVGEGRDISKFVVNQPAYDQETGRLLRVVNDLSVGQFDVVCRAGSTLPTNRHMEEEKYKEYYQMQLIDRTEALKKIDVSDPDAIIARFGEIAQLQGALEQHGDEMKTLQGIIQTLRRQLVQQDIKMTEKEYELLKQAELVAIQAEAKVSKALMSARADLFSNKLTVQHQQVLDSAKMKANAAVEVSKARLKNKEGS